MIKHLKENNETYFSHLIFASNIAIHLFLSSVCLAVHGLIPCWDVPKTFNLESTCKKVQNWNAHRANKVTTK
jgi:hypothetical protein